MKRTACIERLARSIAAVELDHPTRVAIDGVDGAGKTRLADELVAPLARMRREVIRASVDGFHRPREYRYRRGPLSAEGYFRDSFNYPAVVSELLDPLGSQGTRRYRRAVFAHHSDRPLNVGQETASADAILLFDGVFLQRPELASAWDIRIWVDAPFDVTVRRAVARDAIEGGEAAQLRAKYDARYVPGQLIYINECRPKNVADIVFDNAELDNPSLQYREAAASTSGRESVSERQN